MKETPSGRWRASQGVRVLIEAGAGTVTAVAGGFVGALGGLGFCAATGIGNNIEVGCLGPAVLGAGAGLVLGYPLGVWGSGEWAGGDGLLWTSMLGAGLGFGLGLPLAQHLIPAPFVLGMVGGILGYELSQYEAPPSTWASTRPLVLPSVSVSAQGARLGLSGRF